MKFFDEEVPQGFVLRPILFLVVIINNIPDDALSTIGTYGERRYYRKNNSIIHVTTCSVNNDYKNNKNIRALTMKYRF